MKSYQPFLPFPSSSNWVQIRDGNPWAMALFNRHYSKYQYADGRKTKRFVGPGERLVLMLQNGKGLFVWRKFKSLNNQQGVNCAIFRNESKTLSSALILEAEQWAWNRWPGCRLYTYVNPAHIKSKNPGYCFKMAGWQICGTTKKRKLLILEKLPEKDFEK